MLTKSSVMAANDVAKRISASNIVLKSKGSTLLDELQLAVHNTFPININNITNVDSCVTSLYNTEVPVGGYVATHHDTVMDNYITDLSAIVASHINFAKTVVNKQVAIFKEELVQTYNGVKITSPEEVFNVTYFKPHDIFFSAELANEITANKNSTLISLHSSDQLNIHKVDSASIPVNNYLLTGDEQYDSSILSWMGAVTTDRVQGYIQGVWADSIYTMSLGDKLNYSLANYLFYRNLTEKLDINFGLTTLQLRTKATTLRDYYLQLLQSSINLYNTSIKSGMLILPTSDVKFRDTMENEYLEVSLFEENFTKLTEGGGSLETILGYIADSNSYNITYQVLLEKNVHYVGKWDNVRTLFIIKANNNKLYRYKMAVNLAYNKLNGTLEEGEEVARLSEKNYQVVVGGMLNSYLERLTVESFNDLDTLAIKVIAGIRFYYTNAYALLTDMNNILKMSDKITPEEAALFATVNYMTEYMLGQAYVLK